MFARAADAPPVAAAPNDPEAERQAFKVADGMEVTLFASEPMLLKPIQMAFDARGRLWVAGSETYPQVKPGDAPRDKIFVLEDTDGDGRADKSTVFAEGLLIAAGIELGDGGVYVASSTELLHLKDTDGDGKADTRRVVLSGFGTEDTHHVIHGFRWDNAGRLNFMQGIYIGSRIETPHGTVVGLASKLWQLRTESMKLTTYCSGLVNPWGVTWNYYGQTFLTDGAGGEGVNFAPPGVAFTAADGAKRVLKGLNPGSPKYCGAEIVNGRHMPDDWQGDLLTNDFRANRTVRFKLTDDGAGFDSKRVPEDVITSSDKAYRPVDIKTGPDGAIYIADWYNPIINHGEVDFRDPRRDKAHGRIWRLSAKNHPLLPRPKLVDASLDELLTHLLAPEQFTRTQAKLQLRARGAQAVTPTLDKWWKNVDLNRVPTKDKEHALLEALWAYQNVQTIEPKLLARVLKSESPQVRAAGVRVAGEWAGQLPDPLAVISPLIADDNPRVRLEAVLALSAVAQATGAPAAIPMAMRAMEKPIDPFLDYAIYKAVTDTKDIWLPAATAGKLDFANPKQANLAFQLVQSGEALKKVVADLKAGKLTGDARTDAYSLIALLGAPADLSTLLDQAAATAKLDDAQRAAALEALDRASRNRRVQADGPVAARLTPLAGDKDPAVRRAALQLAGRYKLAAFKPKLEAALIDPASGVAMRQVAARALADFGAESIPTLTKYADASQPADVRSAAVGALATVDVKAAAAVAADMLTAGKPGEDPSPILAPFLKREGGVDALAVALQGKTISPDAAKLALRYLRSVGVDLGKLGQMLTTSAGSAGGVTAMSPEQMKQFVDEVASKGDAARGQRVYLSQTAGCVQCHMIAGVGGPLGPDLRAIGASSPVDYIVESILNPAKAVKDGYAATAVVTNEGELIQGIKVREDARELVLRDNLRDEIAIPIANIKSRKEAPSLMPAGLAEAMTRQEFVDLVRFLSELGKPGPYAAPADNVVRRWRTIAGNPARQAGAKPPAAEAGWIPAYSFVEGGLPQSAMLRGGEAGTFVQFELNVAEPGPVRLAFKWNGPLEAWIDGEPLKLKDNEATVSLDKGVRRVTLSPGVAPQADEQLRAEVSEAAGSKAKVSIVIGR